MRADKAIEEICAVRHEISAAYGHDVKAFLAHYRELDRQYEERLLWHKEATPTHPSAQAAGGPNEAA